MHAHHHQHKAPQHLQQQQRLLLYDVPISSELARGDLAPAAARSAAAEHEGSAQPPAVVLDAANMSFMQRLRAVRSLWPYMVPLFVVYFAEYAMQSGTWTAIGKALQELGLVHKCLIWKKKHCRAQAAAAADARSSLLVTACNTNSLRTLQAWMHLDCTACFEKLRSLPALLLRPPLPCLFRVPCYQS